MKNIVKREKHVIDVSGRPLGRVASQIAYILRGKHKPQFERHVDCGDEVEVVNVSKLKFTGNKIDKKLYHHHTGRPGGLKTTTLSARLRKNDGHKKVLFDAVAGMLAKNTLKKEALKRLTFRNED